VGKSESVLGVVFVFPFELRISALPFQPNEGAHTNSTYQYNSISWILPADIELRGLTALGAIYMRILQRFLSNFLNQFRVQLEFIQEWRELARMATH
jgi:hypothetical protein